MILSIVRSRKNEERHGRSRFRTVDETVTKVAEKLVQKQKILVFLGTCVAMTRSL